MKFSPYNGLCTALLTFELRYECLTAVKWIESEKNTVADALTREYAFSETIHLGGREIRYHEITGGSR